MKKLCLSILVLVFTAEVNAQPTKPANTAPVGDTAFQRKADSSKHDYLVIKLSPVIISSMSPLKVTDGTPIPPLLTKENIANVIIGVRIENRQLVTSDGYKLILSKDGKSALLQKMSSAGVSTVVGTMVCNCYGNPSTCMVTITDSRIISLSNDCEDYLLSATVNNSKYLIKLN